jgi:superfamily I DNA/RNA helicase
VKFIQPENWQPQGIDDLEPNAWLALKQIGSTAVIAGPGAGKTEFLAQKAAYLLETGLCPPNKKILAISFKTDAAKNLADRVKERCPEVLSSRLISMTFDAFTKNIVDRFRMALSARWRPTNNYEIAFLSSREEKQLNNHFKTEFNNTVGIYAFTQRLLNMNQFVGSMRLGSEGLSWLEERYLDYWLNSQLISPDEVSKISFMALNRLAEYIIRTNDHVRRAIREAYPFVFLDEFQDTTHAQYDFLLSVFGSGKATVTAVGDYKQRIMGWAGARDDAFHRFEADFTAQQYSLLLNHRSSPELVRIQHVIAQAINPQVSEVEASNHNQLSDNSALIYLSRNKNDEASYLAKWIANDMRSRSLKPRDYSILVRQVPEGYEEPLSSYLMQCGLSLRNESAKIGKTTLQDLLAEDLTTLFCSLLKLGLGQRNAQVWSQLSAEIQLLRNVSLDDEKALKIVEGRLSDFISELKKLLGQPFTSENSDMVFLRVINFINLNDLRKTYARYSTGDLLEINLEALKEFFTKCVRAQNTWGGFLDEFEGVNHIPLMTIHKSKGLEFDTTIFMGIDDQAWWSYRPDDPEGLSTFFVALSRAKQRIIFSYCEERGSRNKIEYFYQLLYSAGLQEYMISSD